MNPTLDMLRAKGYKLRDGVLVRDPISAGGGVLASLSNERATASIKRIGQRRRQRMNRLEQRWFEELKMRHPGSNAIIQPQFSFTLTGPDSISSVRYVPDFLVSWHPGDLWWRHLVWEVKDKRRRYHSVELKGPKLLRQCVPWIEAVHLATWNGSTWTERRLA